MASNLNKAFMRAYAKDSGRPLSAPAAAAVENAPPASSQPANAAAIRQQPVEGTPLQTAFRSAMPRQMPGTQPAGPAPIAAPHLPAQSPAPTQIISGRYVQKAAPAAPADPATVADAASVWQRIDAAQAIQPPHMANPPARPTAAAVGVGVNSGPKRMQAGASAPAAPTARTAGLHQPQTTDLPLLPEEPDTSPANSQAVEARRRTVADFLYSAGKIPGSGVRTPASATTATASAGASASLGASAPVFGGQGRVATMPTERAFAPAATAVQSPLHSTGSIHAAASVHTAAPVHAPATFPEPEALPGSVSSPSVQPPLKRAGQILRVDVPNQARQNATDYSRATAPAHRAIDEATFGQVDTVQDDAPAYKADRIDASVGSATIEQRRIDRAHELSDAEHKLRRSTHKIFNPVWEVDSLQWPGVCDKLMEHRAESMAQVAAHLKAACQDGLSILGVTSPTSGEGRTTVACCLARLAASHGLNVALVDLDLDHPTLCLQTNLEVEHDWRDCLDGDIGLEEVAVHSIDDQLTLLPLRDSSDRPELLASDMGIADLLRELSESFELVIVDACRMNSSGNVISGLAPAQIFDAAIVVVDRRNSQQERIEDAVRALQQTGVGSIGIVDNFSM